MEAGYILALTTGILGGFGHCIGMCGPLVASYTLATQAHNAQSWFSRVSPHVLYNLGRITTYAIIGGIMGVSGSFVNVAGRIAGIQNIVLKNSGKDGILLRNNSHGYIGNVSGVNPNPGSVGIRCESMSTAHVDQGAPGTSTTVTGPPVLAGVIANDVAVGGTIRHYGALPVAGNLPYTKGATLCRIE